MPPGPQTSGPADLVCEESGLLSRAISLYVKEWRQRKKAGVRFSGPEMIQDEIPPSKPLLRLILLIPGEKEGRIQDKIVLQRQSRRTFAAYG